MDSWRDDSPAWYSARLRGRLLAALRAVDGQAGERAQIGYTREGEFSGAHCRGEPAEATGGDETLLDCRILIFGRAMTAQQLRQILRKG